MQCPKCAGRMEKVRAEGATVDRCTGCGGLWFDLLEHKDVRGRSAARELDTGDADVGRGHNAQLRVECPRCHQRMARLTAIGQSHIHYEQCPHCHGAFFDAGEFRDMQTSGIVDRILSLFEREPK